MKNRSKKGFTVVELAISSSIMLSFLAILTSFFFAFNKAANFKIAKMELTSSLKVASERIDKELSDVVKVISTTTTINGVTFNGGCSQTQLALAVASYDEFRNPMFDASGNIITDKVGIQIESIPNKSIYTKLSRNGSYLNRVLLTVEPFSSNGIDGIAGTADDLKSARKSLKRQVIFSSLMPFKSPETNGLYDFPSNSEYSGATTSDQLFISNAFVVYLNQTKTPQLTFPLDPKNISSLKLNYFGEVEYRGKSLITRQESQIVFRNFR
ncbi:MAG: hypothetical protein U0354_04345 [Candidatus Sericytochromatia bacterium]